MATPDLNLHATIIQIAVAYTALGVFIFTAVVSCLALVKVVTLPPKQQATLFTVLVIEIVGIAVGSFSDVLNFNAKKAQTEVRTITAIASGAPLLQAEFERTQNELIQVLKQFQQPERSTLIGIGTGETNEVFLSAKPYNRAIKLYAKAECLAQVGGWMKIVVSGASKKWESGTFYRNPKGQELLSGELRDIDDVPAGQTRNYKASAPNLHADGRIVRLEVTSE